MQQPPTVNVPFNKTTPVICDECDNDKFTPAFLMRRVSKFLSGNGQEGLIPISVFACTKCGHVNKDFLPMEMQDNAA